MISRFLLLACLVLGAACSSLNSPIDWNKPRIKEPAEVPAAIERARAELAEGDTEMALLRLRVAREVRGLPVKVRDELEALIERVVEIRIDELSREGGNPKDLEKMLELDLPNQLAVAAGVRGARMHLDQGKPYKAFKLLRKVEERYPRHHGKVEAGEILAEAGLELANDPWSFLGFWSKRSDGIQVLEYLVITYPSEPRCAEAYFKLARMYEEDRLWMLARQRHEDLRLWHPESVYAVASEASIPRLRLRSLKSPEYERRELLKARFELEEWLRNHAGHDLEARVRLDYTDCLLRLIENDLSVARFYRRIDKEIGARLHADRALEDARNAGLVEAQARAQRVIDTLPPETAQSPAGPAGSIRPIGGEGGEGGEGQASSAGSKSESTQAASRSAPR